MTRRALAEQLDLAVEALLHGSPAAEDAELRGLLGIAADLRDLPRPSFQARLREELERKIAMTTVSIPAGFHTLTPFLVVKDALRLADFLQQAFGAEETHRAVQPGGVHIEMRLGDSMLMIGGGEALTRPDETMVLCLYVPDCDAAFQRAMDAGCTTVLELAERPWGERSGFVRDPFGNVWSLATRPGAAYSRSGYQELLPYLSAPDGHALIDFLKKAFAAQVIGVHEVGGRVAHGMVTIGDSALDVGEPEPDQARTQGGFYLYVDDPDAVYRAALAAGATSLWEPADQRYGDRNAGVLDPFGNRWYPSKNLDPNSRA